MFDSILIANRGEIACRIAATARRMGIRTVAVYSQADAQARHVQACDEAVFIGGPEPKDSYLRADVILQAALRTGAQAIHPGYGFLSENADFAHACADAGLVFIGPPAQAIAAMGSKSAAKALMDKAHVPLVPGYYGDTQDTGFLQDQACQIGYPVLIKASAGGGGKGMRIVESNDAFPAALASCQREAASSFGNPLVLVERYLQKPRHIEIQIFADTQGQCVYLFERDCSVQRRFQKVIEEAPAPGMTPERRAAMGEAAVAAAQAVGYVGAGTVEFIVEPDGRFYFMEMNTRLQVEHPVTEAITGQDLVEWQLRVAAGQPLPLTQDQLQIQGHAIEARVYAENPDKDFLPSIGHLDVLQWPEHVAFEPGPVRVDGGVREGGTITPYYDPMIAKLIVHGRDREDARQRMLHALAAVRATGLHTNIAFLGRLMANPAFVSADLDTGLIPREHDRLFPTPSATPDRVLALGAAAILCANGLSSANPGSGPSPHSSSVGGQQASPWQQVDGWRVGGTYQRDLVLQDPLGEHTLHVQRQGDQWLLAINGQPAQPFAWQADPRQPQRLHIRLGSDPAQGDVQECSGDAYLQGLRLDLYTQGQRHTLQWQDPIALATGQADDAAGGLTAPMPGKILSVSVAPGDAVTQGQPLVVMEAMKMEHTIEAPHDGIVQEVFYAVGDQVTEGVTLIALEAGD
ncbi:acetyl/propionyl/methylcrotonyl-CoA carboxylase subunit alpha [Castellaniella sp.]|uniref:acetyl/propionyl/methylcrotonyl-CoA carboxylase subunit alpha n=1 Tax=Castellaniella sp. TaxID=1955812 RepID=UPI002B003C2F|nr:acetyl/propionyl/methylcrotonyl-CoA carboxylase subunit alpha [Castellaniella sp.]